MQPVQWLTVWALVGLTVVSGSSVARGQAPEFVPVTDSVLLNPDPDDWINWRRTLDGWGYSPLDQITTENVERLQLAWSWAISSEGRPEKQSSTPR